VGSEEEKTEASLPPAKSAERLLRSHDLVTQRELSPLHQACPSTAGQLKGKKLFKDVAMQPTDNIAKKIEPLMAEHKRLRQTSDDTKQ